jgi:cell division protein FtsW (lipid II flippase)
MHERHLLLLAGGFVGVNVLALTLQRPDLLLSSLWLVAAWLAAAVGSFVALKRFMPQHDPLFLPLILLMVGWGLVLIERLAPNFAVRQALWLLISTAAMLSVALLPHMLRWLRVYRYLWLAAGLGLLVSTIAFGSNPSGQLSAPQLWLGRGGFFFQPSEPLKIILVAFLASYLAEQYPLLRAEGLAGGSIFSPRLVGPVLLMWGLSVVILVWQRDLGTAVLFFVVFLILLYVASGYTALLLGGGLLIVVAAVVAYQLFDVVQLRVDIWLNPWPESDGRAYQIVQSLQAFAAGGVFGQGIGQGSPVYVPVVHSDFIFAALAEEYGFLGVIVVLVGFGTLVVRGMQIAIRQQGRPFRALLAIGLVTLLGGQAILIMGGTIRLLPLTGVTLPFFSYGGSSLLVSFCMVGLLLRLSALDDV